MLLLPRVSSHPPLTRENRAFTRDKMPFLSRPQSDCLLFFSLSLQIRASLILWTLAISLIVLSFCTSTVLLSLRTPLFSLFKVEGLGFSLSITVGVLTSGSTMNGTTESDGSGQEPEAWGEGDLR